MKRELKEFPGALVNSRRAVVAKLIPMKRELKVDQTYAALVADLQ